MAAPLVEQNTSGSEIWNTTLELKSGDLIQVLAPSGKGKSTFIQILYGNRKDYEGDVYLNDINIKEFTGDQLATLRQNKLSIIFQELLLFPELTGWQNIEIKLSLTKYYEREKIDEMATRLNVRNIMDRKCGQMSFGERQRIAIIRALVQPFEWILLDEPYSHLDLEISREAGELIQEECKSRKAGLIITSLDGDDYIDYQRRLIL